MKKRFWLALAFILFILSWIILLQFISPEQLIENLGIRNTYVGVFVLSVLVSGSSFTAGPFYVILGTMYAAGLSLHVLSFLSGLGGMVGDTFYYYFGKNSSKVFPLKVQRLFDKMNALLQRHPRLTPLFVFLYAAFMPMPNDLMTVSLGLSNYPYRRMAIPLFFGNVVFFYLLLTVSGNIVAFFS